MPVITFPDGKQKQFDEAVSVLQIAQSIGPGLAKATLAGKVDNKVVDAAYIVANDAQVQIITDKDPEGLELIRHSSAHLLAHAVKSLFPSAQVTIGPVVENGFYYDFAFERPFTPEDIEKIEAKMEELAKQDLPVKRREMPRDEAIQFFRDMGETYKAEIIQDIPANETLSLYEQGDFIDLCRGPHIPNTARLKAFKLTKVAGAYWRGDAKNEMLQRIYGTAWANKKDLQAYLEHLEEVEKRDHRRLGKQLNLFHFQEEAPGMAFWHPNGWRLYQVVEQYIRNKLIQYNYKEIKTPQLVDLSLWKRSGHWSKYHSEMFTVTTDTHEFAIKPMNCPCHVQVFNQGIKSYRDLPIRYAEFGSCHRDEISGALHGLMRVRNFVQDDAHIFCTEEQIQAEVANLIQFVLQLYADFGFEELEFRLSTRPEERIGSDETWDKAEKALEKALDNQGIDWILDSGDGAFYGPKIDFKVRDSLGRLWQCATIQVDFAMPERLDAQYIDEDGTKKHPVMIHRAILGSFERFLGVLIEHFAGKFPAWLAPVQVVVMNITDKQAEYCQKIAEILKNRGFRAEFDLRNEKIGFKIREHTLMRVPYLVVIGDREQQSNTLAIRTRQGQDLGVMSLDSFIEYLEQDVAQLGRGKLEE